MFGAFSADEYLARVYLSLSIQQSFHTSVFIYELSDRYFKQQFLGNTFQPGF